MKNANIIFYCILYIKKVLEKIFSINIIAMLYNFVYNIIIDTNEIPFNK